MDVEMVFMFTESINSRRFVLVLEETFLGCVCIHTDREKTRSRDVGM